MRILLFGGTGQVGTLLAAALKSHTITAPGRSEVDLQNAEAVRAAVAQTDPDVVVNAAGMANADFCEDRPSDAYAVKVDGARAVAEAARGRLLVFFSTDHVFDGKAGPYSEEDRPNPLSVYGRTKIEAERIVRTVHPRPIVVRTTLLYAPGDRSFFSRLVSATQPVPCWTDHVGTYTYGPNFAEAVAELLERGMTGLWHVAGPDTLDRHAFALKVAARFGRDPSLFKPVSIAQAPPRAPRPLRAGLRSEKARAALKTKLLSVDEGLELAYRAYGHP